MDKIAMIEKVALLYMLAKDKDKGLPKKGWPPPLRK